MESDMDTLLNTPMFTKLLERLSELEAENVKLKEEVGALHEKLTKYEETIRMLRGMDTPENIKILSINKITDINDCDSSVYVPFEHFNVDNQSASDSDISADSFDSKQSSDHASTDGHAYEQDNKLNHVDDGNVCSKQKVIEPNFEKSLCDTPEEQQEYLTKHGKSESNSSSNECNECTTEKETRAKSHESLRTGNSEKQFVAKAISSVSTRSVKNEPKTCSKKLTCSVCNKSYKIASRFRKHMATHSKVTGVNYKSDLPTESDALPEEINSPLILNNDNQTTYTCDICDTHYESSLYLKQHMSGHSLEEFKCSICDKLLGSTHTLKRHMKIHTEEKKHSCSTCGKQFLRSADLGLHTMIHTGGCFSCTMCDKTFTRKSKLDNHMWRHSGVKSHCCETCGASFARLEILKRHIRRDHEGIRQLTCCNVCGKFVNHIRMHMLVHDNTKSFECMQCGKKFRTKANMKEHSIVHTGHRPFTCEQCGKSFKLKNALTKHLQGHAGVRPFTCSTCGRSFQFTSGLKTHMSIHSDVREYSCDVCHKTFKRKKCVEEHRLIHTGERPHKCNLCEKTFRQNVHLTTHVKSVHGTS